MSEIVRCPDCGGIVGATETTDEGRPCTCFVPPPPETDSHGTDVVPAPTTSQKFCCVCGTDLSGKKRFKDSRGYWCPECAKEDQAKKEEKGTPCAQCRRKVPEQSMTSVDGKLLCTRCVREQRELRAPGNKRYRRIDDTTFKQAEKKQMVMMAIALVILLILMYIAWQRRPWAHSRANDAIGESTALAQIDTSTRASMANDVSPPLAV
jgi:hypothetical protein